MRNNLWVVEDDELIVQILGPVQLVGSRGEVIDLPSASQRRLLGALAIHAPAPVRAEWLCGVLDVTNGALRTSISRLRRLVGDGALLTTVGGYRLDATVDATVACEALRSASGDAAALARALDRWAGPALEEFADEPWAVGESVRLAQIRATATEDLAEALIAEHRATDALALIDTHLVEHPLRDRPRGLKMRALAAAGRQTEALRAFQEYRDLLAERAGTEPSSELRAIDQRIATGWDGRDNEEPTVDLRDTPHTEGARPRPPLHEVITNAPSAVGRWTELAALADAAEATRDEGIRTVLVSGEAGIGKTTLIASFARGFCATSGWSVLYGRCDEHVAVPFQPFQALLTPMVDALPDDALVDHAATCGGDLLRLLPKLQQRIATPPVPTGDEATARHQLFEAVADIIDRTAALAPLVLVLDDLHWAEPAALQLLRYLVRNLGRAPVLVVAGFRDTGEAADDELRTALADLARSDAVRLELEGLDTLELGDLVHARITDGPECDVGQLARRLHTETAGNPLFAEHLLRHWMGTSQLDIDDGGVTPPVSSVLDVPSALRDLVWHRVAVLGPEARPVLTAAAVFGVQFNERVLAAMTDLAGHDVARQLDRAVAAGVLADHPSIWGTVRFTHALVARSLEAELGTRAAASLHAQAFAATLAVGAAGAAEMAPQLARHAELGGLLDEAQRWATMAGGQALADLAPDEAARWFRKALEHAAALDRPDAERAELLVELGEAATRAGDPTALDTIREGAELARACGDDATLIRAALATSRGSVRLAWSAERLAIVEAAVARADSADLETRARLTALLAVSLCQTDQDERRRAVALEALDLARSSLDPTLLARVAPDVLWALWAPGSAAIRSDLAAEATAIANESNDPHLAYVVHLVAWTTAICAADAESAGRYLEGLRTIVNEIGEPVMRWNLGVVDGHQATLAARFDDAERILADTVEQGMQIGEADAFTVFAAQTFALSTYAGRHAELFPLVEQVLEASPHIEPVFRLAHAVLCCEVGRPEVARALMREAMAAGLEAISQDWVGSTALIAHALLAIELEDVAAAEWLYPSIEPMAGEVSFNGITSQGPISAYLGKLASLLDRYDDAERHLLDTLATTVAFGWEYHRATTLIALAQNQVRRRGVLDDQGERWLATAEQLCSTHGIASWAKRAARMREPVPS